MKPDIIIVTGNSISGKTEIANRISKHIDFDVFNIGDQLERELSKIGKVEQQNRESTGRMFFQYFTQDDYNRILFDLLRRNIILDGIRIPTGLEHIKENSNYVFYHIHRLKNNSDLGIRNSSDVFKKLAHKIVNWQSSITELNEIIESDILPEIS